GGGGDAEVGMVLHVVLVNEVEPAPECVQPAAAARRDGEPLGEICDARHIARRRGMFQALFDRADLDRPGRCGAMECARLVRFGSLELPGQEVADDAWIPIAATAMVEGHRNARPFDRLQYLCRVGSLEKRVARLRGELREDGSLQRELPLHAR